ncbi:UDP-glucose dehydrogenase family protein [Corynebacterium fournieri]|uniref:UDP-glucose dehydrogenase family protein n=1 Tax=Corynebacterium fournieri TaxID=1852390 RepID=UPI001E48E077|nr:nucleotide sugar dehydrogenase [Corynebacterium fournieri]
MRMTVIGTGYLGATHAACMAELGHEVLGVDVDESKIQALKNSKVPFYEPGLPEVLERNIDAGRLDFTTDYAEAAAFANVHFIGVGTPQQRGSYAADTRYVEAVIDDLVPQLEGEHLILGKSTVPVGTAAALQERADRLVANAGGHASVEIAWNPEFLREGYAVKDTIEPDRIVLGTRAQNGSATHGDSRAEEIAREVYATPLSHNTPFIVTDLQTAELVKVSANAFLATKISFINAVSEVCENVGADVTQLADAIGYDDRIGRKFLGAGLGFGGGCLPKDIRAFMARAGTVHQLHTLITQAIKPTNTMQHTPTTRQSNHQPHSRPATNHPQVHVHPVNNLKQVAVTHSATQPPHTHNCGQTKNSLERR